MGGDCGQSPVPSVGDLSYGGGRPGRARPTATSAQPISTQPRPRTNNVLKKKDCFFLIFSDVRRSRMARRSPVVRGGGARGASCADCAVGSG